MDNIPIIITGPPGSGKSYWIQQYAKAMEKQLLFVHVVKIVLYAMDDKTTYLGTTN